MNSDRATSYADGFSAGARWAEHDDTFARSMIPEILADAAERASNALRDSQRAFWLGALRGYRGGLSA